MFGQHLLYPAFDFIIGPLHLNQCATVLQKWQYYTECMCIKDTLLSCTQNLSKWTSMLGYKTMLATSKDISLGVQNISSVARSHQEYHTKKSLLSPTKKHVSRWCLTAFDTFSVLEILSPFWVLPCLIPVDHCNNVVFERTKWIRPGRESWDNLEHLWDIGSLWAWWCAYSGYLIFKTTGEVSRNSSVRCSKFHKQASKIALPCWQGMLN